MTEAEIYENKLLENIAIGYILRLDIEVDKWKRMKKSKFYLKFINWFLWFLVGLARFLTKLHTKLNGISVYHQIKSKDIIHWWSNLKDWSNQKYNILFYYFSKYLFKVMLVKINALYCCFSAILKAFIDDPKVASG